MAVSDLSTYGTGEGLTAWSLDLAINDLQLPVAERLVTSAKSFLSIYGPFDTSKPAASTLLVEAVYTLAEMIYFWRSNMKTITSPFKSERSGSYSYDKGSSSQQQIQDLIENHGLLWPLIIYLKDVNGALIRVGTRIHEESLANPNTGWRDLIILSHSNRVQRAVNRRRIVSDTDEFNYLVYGDKFVSW